MTEPAETVQQAKRRRWINFGELIGLAAVVIAALGLWNSWRNDDSEKTPRQVEAKTSIPIAFRGKVESGGKAMTISPVEAGHSLESLTLSVAGKPAVSIGGPIRAAHQ